MRVEVMNRQMTIDFLNESFQQESNADATSYDYMEKIKQINIDWIRIKSLISARIDVGLPLIFIINSICFFFLSRLWNN